MNQPDWLDTDCRRCGNRITLFEKVRGQPVEVLDYWTWKEHRCEPPKGDRVFNAHLPPSRLADR